MKNILFQTILLVGMISLLGACKPKAAEGIPSGLPQDFNTFYQQFHTDSVYQMAHIRFPLEGLPADVDSTTYTNGGFQWTADNWTLQREMNPEKLGFIRSVSQPMPDVVIETTKQQQGPYAIIRRFYKQDGEWYLIYYMDMNKVE